MCGLGEPPFITQAGEDGRSGLSSGLAHQRSCKEQEERRKADEKMSKEAAEAQKKAQEEALKPAEPEKKAKLAE